MKQLFFVCSVFFLAACTSKPVAGGSCSANDNIACASGTAVYACINSVWVSVPCGGLMGCVETPVVTTCDTSRAKANEPCPPWSDGAQSCSDFPAAVVRCSGGAWQILSSCTNGCSATTGLPTCIETASGGGTAQGGGAASAGGGTASAGGGTASAGGGTASAGGGTASAGGGTAFAGGGTASAGGGAASAGGGIASTGGGTASAGGGVTASGGGSTAGGGTAACGPGNCSGCCANGQCFAAPLNGTTNFCGSAGLACDDCGARGQRCDTATLVCVASTSCNAASCPNGCCASGQCFNAPLNQTTNFCGRNGNACVNCQTNGLVCNAATFICVPSGAGGGSAAGGGTASGGGSAAGGGTASGGGMTTDPCMGVPTAGQCLSTALVQYCNIPTGAGNSTVQTYQCQGGSSCQSTGAGASCIRTGACIPGDTRCTGPTTAQQCNNSGVWANATCGANPCINASFGANCGINVGATTSITATLKFEAKAPLANFSNWGPLLQYPARNVLVISQRGTSWVDTTTTNANGLFTIKVPSPATAQDTIVFMAAGGDGLGERYSIVDPGLGTGTFSTGQQSASVRNWSWSKAVSAVTSGSTTVITAAQGSGALNMFDMVQGVFSDAVASNEGRQGIPITMFMGIGTEWTCGACFSETGSNQSGIWMPGGAQDEGYWSDYTLAHELGHWQQASYGTSPNEGGPHTLSCATFPGQAYSEGYATWHSSAIRNDPVCSDKQQGGFFWFNIQSRSYYPGSTQPFNINGPGGTNLLAQIDENAVSAMLWTLSQSRQSGTEEIFNAISGNHMKTTPWPRLYTRRTWSVGANCAKTNVVNTNQSAPHVADLFDALRCGGAPVQSNGMTAATLNSSTFTQSYYPYPAATPICRSGFCYGCKDGANTCQAGNTATACGTNGVSCSACPGAQTCQNGVCR
jgi:hypothetical protein